MREVSATRTNNDLRRLDPASSVPFFLIHAAALLALWRGPSPTALAVCLVTYLVRMFAITAGFHRYFAHKSFRTGRAFQFILALAGGCAAQKGVLWWAAHHRHHHAHSDTEADVHSPVTGGFWRSHCGWFLCNEFDETQYRLIPDLLSYPELRFLNRWHGVPPTVLALLLYGFGTALERFAPVLRTNGPETLIWGFFVSTVAVYHCTFCVNSLAHIFGTRRFETRDHSRNNWWIAIITLGEGWHNNHHYSPSRERQGIIWWEIDVAHYCICALRRFGLVSHIRGTELPPQIMAIRQWRTVGAREQSGPRG